MSLFIDAYCSMEQVGVCGNTKLRKFMKTMCDNYSHFQNMVHSKFTINPLA